ncbi:MAG: mechanosensitive ion channel [Actinophytocola sp.]|nr:mechanosensitive ion channel [Actinophytocola sp.]
MAQAGPIVDWFSQHVGAIVASAINILIIIAIALVARAVIGRLITHLINRMVKTEGKISAAASKTRAKVLKSDTSRAERQQQRAETIGTVLKSIASIVILGIAVLTILAEFGINLGPILATAGVLGLAIGFGAQSVVQDFVSGMFMMVEDQYGVGDVVDAGEAVGTVEAVTLRVTKIRDLNGNLWHVRNGEIMRVCNMNQDWSNAVIELPLDYSEDIVRAQDVIQRCIDEFADNPDVSSRLLERPSINGVVGIGNGAVTIRVLATTKPGEQWGLGRELRAHLKQSMDRENVKVAQPILPMSDAGATKSG